MGISEENLCLNLEVETVTDLYNPCNWDKPNGLRVPEKNQMNSFLLYTTFALETKGNSDDEKTTKQAEFISLTAMWAVRLHFALFPLATSTAKRKLIR